MVATAPHPTPLHDRVLIKPVPPAELSKGGLVIPDTAQEQPDIGDVLAVGPGRATDYGTTVSVPRGVVPGARVRYARHAGVPAPTAQDPSLVLVRGADVLAIEG